MENHVGCMPSFTCVIGRVKLLPSAHSAKPARVLSACSVRTSSTAGTIHRELQARLHVS